MSAATDALALEVQAITRELESLSLEKANRDRRLALNAQLEAKRAALAAQEKSDGVKAALTALETQLAALTDAPADKAKKRELRREKARLESELKP